MLWFAFILVSLNHWKQLPELRMWQVLRCDLLSFIYLWTIGNSSPPCSNWNPAVVICFHFSIFEPLETAKTLYLSFLLPLWFAFILVSLNHWKQLDVLKHRHSVVVICFHFSIFEPLETAMWICYRHYRGLWFAFILVSLNHWKQRTTVWRLYWNRCDLLSF